MYRAGLWNSALPFPCLLSLKLLVDTQSTEWQKGYHWHGSCYAVMDDGQENWWSLLRCPWPSLWATETAVSELDLVLNLRMPAIEMRGKKWSKSPKTQYLIPPWKHKEGTLGGCQEAAAEGCWAPAGSPSLTLASCWAVRTLHIGLSPLPPPILLKTGLNLWYQTTQVSLTGAWRSWHPGFRSARVQLEKLCEVVQPPHTTLVFEYPHLKASDAKHRAPAELLTFPS